MYATTVDTSPRPREGSNNTVDLPSDSLHSEKVLQNVRPTATKTDSPPHPLHDIIIDNKLKQNATKYSISHENDIDDFEDEDDEDGAEEGWDFDMDLEEEDIDFDEDMEYLSRQKRRKAKFSKKNYGYGGSKGSKTSSGSHGMGPDDAFEGGKMGRKKKKGKFSNEYYIKRSVLKNYDRTTRPVKNDSTTVTTVIGMSLYHILDTVSSSFLWMLLIWKKEQKS